MAKTTKTKGAKAVSTKTKAPKAAGKTGTAKTATTGLPMPEGVPVVPMKLAKGVRRAEARHLAPLMAGGTGGPEVMDRLWHTIEERKNSGSASTSHSARLIARGTAKVAQKLGEEAVECVIEATLGNRQETVLESADLLYHLLVVWVDAGIRPEEVWGELVRREGVSGLVEKASRPKGIVRAARTTKLP